MSINFLLGQKQITERDFDTNKTLLEYLRTDIARTGSKEGCAEGDCGACTVIIGSWRDGDIHLKLANACILLLAGCHEKLIITIEDLSHNDSLHPLQQAFIDTDAQQCGFCTPGILMALAWHEHAVGKNDAHSIDVAMAGNLCRCTGYASIRRAARLSTGKSDPRLDNLLQHAKPILQKWHKPPQSLSLNEGHGEFYAPTSEQELAQHLADHKDARMIAGGTDLMLDITKKLQHYPHLVSVMEVASLHAISQNDDAITIGGALSYERALPLLVAAVPQCEQILLRLGGPQVRACGSVGGNIANGSPIGDGPPLLIALGAQLELASLSGSRTIALEDFFIDYGKQDLRAGEYVARIIIPKPKAGQVFWGHKISKRFDQDISAVLMAGMVTHVDGKITDARIAFGGMAATPKRASNVEQALKGCALNESSFVEAAASIGKDYQPIGDMRASAQYRQKIGTNLIARMGMYIVNPDQDHAMLDSLSNNSLLEMR